jgi:PIN domain nuclease of toxin-antitoxin system
MPEVVVLDSHVWFWWINQEHQRLGPHLLGEIEKSERVGVSPVSCFELALARRRGRLRLPLAPSEWFVRALAGSGVELLPLMPDIAVKAVGLPDIHRDPFDRIIIATCLILDGRLASVDGCFEHYPELKGRLVQRQSS